MRYNTVSTAATPADALDSPPPFVPMVSQTQDDDEDFPPSDEDDDLPRFMEDGGVSTADVASHLNVQLDGKDDYLAAELDTIVDDRYLAGVLELQVRYTNGDLSWHPIDLIKNEEPQAVANYVLSNDLGMVSNGIHRRWARSFLRALKRTLRRMKRVDFYDLEA